MVGNEDTEVGNMMLQKQSFTNAQNPNEIMIDFLGNKSVINLLILPGEQVGIMVYISRSHPYQSHVRIPHNNI